MVRFAVPPVSIPGPAVNSGSVSVVAIIPAQIPVVPAAGQSSRRYRAARPMIEHVYRRTAAARSVGVVIVATDDQRICDAVEAFGGRAQLTSPTHQSGTDRLAEVAAGLTVRPRRQRPGGRTADRAVDDRRRDRAVPSRIVRSQMTTLRRRIDDRADLQNPNVTKVVVDRDGYALYFSRAPIPFTRAGCPPAPAWRHVGLYVYRRECLLRLTAAAADRDGTGGGARAAARARARHPDQGGRDGSRLRSASIRRTISRG